METYTKGTCEMMCPQSEIKMRTSEMLLHFYELIDPISKTNIPNTSKVVKSFARSAAGNKSPKASDLRTPETLYKTIEYLLSEILEDCRKPYYFRYDFIFDRLRSIRQEIVIQNLCIEWSIKLLEPIIMFLAFSSYRLCEQPISIFDSKICAQHLQECLKKLLCFYDKCKTNNLKNRFIVESIYLMYNIGSTEALTRAISLPDNIKQTFLVNLTLNISIEKFKGNFYRCINLIDHLPHIVHGIACLEIPNLRKEVLLRLSHGFHSKILTVPLKWLYKILFYNKIDDLITDCKLFGITIVDDDNVMFNKNQFDSTKNLLPTHHDHVDDKLNDIVLSDEILFK